MTPHEQHMANCRTVQRRTQLDRLRHDGRAWARLFPEDADAVASEINRLEVEMRENGQEP